MTNKLWNAAIVITVLVFFILVFFIVSFGVNGCSVAPRSETYCLKNNQWVKCPKGKLPRTEL